MSTNDTITVYKEFTSTLQVWKYFLKADNGLTAKCKLCNVILKTSARSPKGLHVHLKSIHKIDTKTSVDPLASSSRSGTASASTSSFQPQLEHENVPLKKIKINDNFKPKISLEMRVSRMISKSGLTFRVFCECEDLRELFCSQGYKLPTSPNSIKLMVLNYGATLKMQVKEDLAKLKEKNQRFNLTFDKWTSVSSKRFLNINVHACIEGKAVFWNLGLVRVFGSMPATSCVQLLTQRLLEFDLSLDKDIVAVTTDGASVMVKVGGLIKPLQQLCYAQGIQLGIIDVIYKKSNSTENEEVESTVPSENVQEETRAEVNDDGHDEGFFYSIPFREVELAAEYQVIIIKLRKLVNLFKLSPTKNDLLQIYIQEEFGQKLQLVLDCKTRWSSLADMISVFIKVKQCISKALIDLKLDCNPNYFFKEEEYAILLGLERAFQPVKLAVDVLCRRDSNLVSAEITLRFMIRKLEEQHTPLSIKLVQSLRNRITQRRITATATLLYLTDPSRYEEDLGLLADDQTFKLPPKSVVRKEIKSLIERLYCNTNLVEVSDPSTTDAVTNPSTSVVFNVNVKEELDDDALFYVEVENSQLQIQSQPKSLQEELENTLTTFKNSSQVPWQASMSILESIIKKEMHLFEYGGSRGKHLQLAYDSLVTIVPTSVESERAFSSAGYVVTHIGSRLCDNTIDTLCFLRSFFQNSVP